MPKKKTHPCNTEPPQNPFSNGAIDTIVPCAFCHSFGVVFVHVSVWSGSLISLLYRMHDADLSKESFYDVSLPCHGRMGRVA